ncbi:MAG: radical SAM protein [Pseudomonadota bacterium]
MLVSLPGLRQDDGHLFPLGIGYLSASLKQNHEVVSCHFNRWRQAQQELPSRYRLFRPEIIGLTCNSFNRGFVRDAIKQIRSLGIDTKVVVGGVHASFCHDQILRRFGADVVVVGEGEITFSELCDTIVKGTSLSSVNGIVFRDGDEVLITPPRDRVTDLDALPIPDYSYASMLIRQTDTGFLITSRGCPVRCTFCSTSSYWGQKVRMHSSRRVVDEMEMLVSQFNVRKIFFHDDTFNLSIARVKDICGEIIKRGIKVEWACSCRVAPVSDEMLTAMVDAGCRHICWGVESGSEQIIKTIDKKISLSQVRNAFAISNKYSHVLSTGAFTMVGNPGESKKTIDDTVRFFNSIPMTDPPSTSILYVLPGTILNENLKQAGHITDEDWANHDSVPPYTVEHSLWTLERWRRRVVRSGQRVPFVMEKHFWHTGSKTYGLADVVSATARKVADMGVRFGKAVIHINDYGVSGRLLF